MEPCVMWTGMLGLNVTEEYIRGAWSVYDVDGNGELNREEFLHFMSVLRAKDTKGYVL